MVTILKLTTAEELLCDVLEETSESIIFKNPLLLISLPPRTADEKNNRLGATPFMQYAKTDKIEIHKMHVMLAVEPNKELADMYRQSFSSVITPAAKKIII